MMRLMSVTLIANLFSLLSIFYLNNFESIEITTSTRQVIVLASSVVIFLCFGMDQYYPRFGVVKSKKYFLLQIFFISIISLAAFFYESVEENYYLASVGIAGVAAAIHLNGNLSRASGGTLSYLVQTQIVSKVLIFILAFGVVKGFGWQWLGLAIFPLLVVMRWFPLHHEQSENGGSVSSMSILVGAMLSIFVTFLLRAPYFHELAAGAPLLALNSMDLITTSLLLVFLPIAQLQKFREVSSEFRVDNFNKYNISDTSMAAMLSILAFIALTLMASWETVYLEPQFSGKFLVVFAVYAAFFSSRNFIQITILDKRNLKKILIPLVLLSLIVAVTGYYGVGFYASLFVLVSIPVALSWFARPDHANWPLFMLACVAFLIGVYFSG